jgi:hypothetical protein
VKVEDFLSKPIPGQRTVEEVIAEVEAEKAGGPLSNAERQARYRAKDIEAARARAREHNKSRRERCGDEIREYDRARKNGTYADRDPLKETARRAARKLPSLPCEVCGETQADKHHDDYSKPLDVRYLCKAHHGELHRKTDEEVAAYSSTTPSGVLIEYSPSPRRFYRVNGVERPSVTTVLNVLDKSGAIGWWSFRVGLKAIIELYSRGLLPAMPNEYDFEQFEKLIVQHKLSPNHVKDEAAGRGVNIHSAFETWASDPSYRPVVDLYPESEQGYVTGLNQFLDDLGEVSSIEAEVMVGSVEHGFAGRYDLRLTLPTPREMVVKTYPKRKSKVEEVPAGKWLLDLKTSKDCYPTHSLQLAAYEAASIECGYGPTDYRAVVHVTADGRYEIRRATATAEDFLTILAAHGTMQQKTWFA